MAKEYIEREALLHKIRWASSAEEAVMSVRRIPTADVVPVVHGRWVNTHSDSEFVQCSLCKYPVYAAWNVTSYCPNCGAKMDKEDEPK